MPSKGISQPCTVPWRSREADEVDGGTLKNLLGLDSCLPWAGRWDQFSTTAPYQIEIHSLDYRILRWWSRSNKYMSGSHQEVWVIYLAVLAKKWTKGYGLWVRVFVQKKVFKLGGRKFLDLEVMKRNNSKGGISKHFWSYFGHLQIQGIRFVSHDCHQFHRNWQPRKPRKPGFTQKYVLDLPEVFFIRLFPWPRGKGVWLVSHSFHRQSIRITKSATSVKPENSGVYNTTTSLELPILRRRNRMGSMQKCHIPCHHKQGTLENISKDHWENLTAVLKEVGGIPRHICAFESLAVTPYGFFFWTYPMLWLKYTPEKKSLLLLFKIHEYGYIS